MSGEQRRRIKLVKIKICNSSQRLVREAEADVTAGKTALAIDEIWDIVEREALRGSPKFANEVVDLRKYVTVSC